MTEKGTLMYLRYVSFASKNFDPVQEGNYIISEVLSVRSSGLV